MKLAKSTLLAWVAVSAIAGFLLLTATACKKAVSTGANSSTLTPEQARQQRLDWNLETLVEPYKKAGFADTAWDEPAKRALTAFANLRSERPGTGPWEQIIATNCDLAIRAGCKDPMIEYLHIRFLLTPADSPKAYADALCQAALHMKESSYPAIRKFYANRRAVQEFYKAYGTKADRTIIEQVGGTAFFLPAILNDPTIPVEEAYDACDETLEAYGSTKDVREYEAIYQQTEKTLFDRWPQSHLPWLIKGAAHVKMAWICRGGGYADTVTKEGWKGFESHLEVAQQALERAWGINQQNINIPLKMMKVELGQGQGRERMELWFKRAMAIDTNSYAACYAKLYYLEPKWHGSRDAMLDFGRDCVGNTNWGGKVPLVLVDAHWNFCRGYIDKAEQTNYWKQPDVWLDIKSAYDRFFLLNPNPVGYIEYYAWYAYQAEQWDVLNGLIPKLGPETYYKFGGKDEYDKMVRLAKEHAGSTHF